MNQPFYLLASTRQADAGTSHPLPHKEEWKVNVMAKRSAKHESEFELQDMKISKRRIELNAAFVAILKEGMREWRRLVKGERRGES